MSLHSSASKSWWAYNFSVTPEKEERCASDVNLYWSPIDFSKQTQGKLSRGMVNTKTEFSQNIQKKKKIQFNFEWLDIDFTFVSRKTWSKSFFPSNLLPNRQGRRTYGCSGCNCTHSFSAPPRNYTYKCIPLFLPCPEVVLILAPTLFSPLRRQWT